MPGQTTPQFQRWVSIFEEAKDKSFSIVYTTADNEERTLDVIAPSPDIYYTCFNGLNAKVKAFKEQRENYSLDNLYLKTLYDRADVNHDNSLSTNEVISIVATMNLNMPSNQIKAMITKFDVDKNGTFDFNEFVEFMGFLRKRFVTNIFFL
jgi:hypothetical protein